MIIGSTLFYVRGVDHFASLKAALVSSTVIDRVGVIERAGLDCQTQVGTMGVAEGIFIYVDIEIGVALTG